MGKVIGSLLYYDEGIYKYNVWYSNYELLMLL